MFTFFRKSDFAVSTLRFRLCNIANKKKNCALEQNNPFKYQNQICFAVLSNVVTTKYVNNTHNNVERSTSAFE